MRTFASEFVQEPLMGGQPHVPEVTLLHFDAIAARGLSLGNTYVLVMFKSCADLPSPSTCEGVTQWTSRLKPLTVARYGTLFHGRVVRWRFLYQRDILRTCFLFIVQIGLFTNFLLFTPKSIRALQQKKSKK